MQQSDRGHDLPGPETSRCAFPGKTVRLSGGCYPGCHTCHLWQFSMVCRVVLVLKVKVKVAQSSLTLCDPKEFSRPQYWSG